MAHDANLAHMGQMTVATWSIFLAHRHPTICVPLLMDRDSSANRHQTVSPKVLS